MEQQRVQLENALKEINEVKRKLQQNVSEVKLQVQTAVSRNLEALRNREVWLLNQVELLQSAKDEVLSRQQAKLHKLLGFIQTQKGGTTLTRIDPSDLKPEESAYLNFRCDASSLRESINSFGKIEASGLPHAVFVQAGNPSTSLPKHVEEYEDAEQDVLYKTLQEIQQAKTSSSCIDVRIPKLSPRADDWLAKPSTISMISVSEPKFTMPKLSNKKDDWLYQSAGNNSSSSLCSTTNSVSSIMSGHVSSLTSSHSVPSLTSIGTFSSTQSWLKQIKQDQEDEDDFEIVETGGSSGTPETDMDFHHDFVISPSHSAPNLLQWTYKPSSTVWLKSRPSVGPTDCKSHDVFQHYFATVSQDSRHWLAKKTENCCNQACQSKKPVDIENLGSCLGHDHPKASDFTWLCTASEPCKDVKECSTEPSCFDKFLQKNPTCKLTSTDPMIDKMRKTYSGPVDTGAWLLKAGSIQTSPNAANFNPLKKYLSNTSKTSSDWLKPCSPSKEAPREGISFKHIDTKLSSWIMASNSKMGVDSSENQKKILPSFALKDNQRWLMSKSDSGTGSSSWISGSEKQSQKGILFQSFDQNNSQWLMKSGQTVKS